MSRVGQAAGEAGGIPNPFALHEQTVRVLCVCVRAVYCVCCVVLCMCVCCVVLCVCSVCVLCWGEGVWMGGGGGSDLLQLLLHTHAGVAVPLPGQLQRGHLLFQLFNALRERCGFLGLATHTAHEGARLWHTKGPQPPRQPPPPHRFWPTLPYIHNTSTVHRSMTRSFP